MIPVSASPTYFVPRGEASEQGVVTRHALDRLLTPALGRLVG